MQESFVRRSVRPMDLWECEASLRRVFTILCITFFWLRIAGTSTQISAIDVTVDRSIVGKGDTITVDVRLSGQKVTPQLLDAVILRPNQGTFPLILNAVPGLQGRYQGKFVIGENDAEGLYGIHVWSGENASPLAVGKASFRLGKILLDFFVAPYLDSSRSQSDLDSYLDEFQRLGGNFLIAHNLITTQKAYYPSKICRTDVQPGSPNDVVERVLASAEKRGIGVLLSVAWDMTGNSHFKDRLKEIKAILDELYRLYKHHPSLVGFYSWQEGSGTYYAPFIREFSEHVKILNPNLLTACAPHVDDPLLAGYLSAIESLDIIIYQAGVMASYRTDNRKKYPHRRVRDFCGLGAGAKQLQGKIAINHVELFGYLEQRLHPKATATSYENIYRQILSAATVTDADGLSLFSYHAHIFNLLKQDRQVEESRKAVVDGVEAFRLITSKVSHRRNDIALYFPYSDWIIERWPNYFLPALDAFRVLGVPVDILPYAPPLVESVYPYYPYNMNRDVLARLLKERPVLVLPNVSGFQQTDSDLIKTFVEEGGIVVAFGPQIPMGRSYERGEVFGISEGLAKKHRSVVVTQGIGQRVPTGRRFPLSDGTLTGWTSVSARVVAAFDDGSPAVATNRYGKGMTVSILSDALTAARYYPDLVLDVIDEALKSAGHQRVVDIRGLNENVDVAIAQTSTGVRVAVVNHGSGELVAEANLLDAMRGEANWIDVVTGRSVATERSKSSLDIRVPPASFRCLEYRSPSYRQ